MSQNIAKPIDYIVVGAGAAGGPLACRLARLGANVLLIDAGQYTGENPFVEIPIFNLRATEDPKISWSFMVEHYGGQTQQKNDFKALNSSQTYQGVLYPRASAIGGCTTHHAMIQMYPHDDDWRFLQELTGDDNWSPDFMRRLYVERIERCLFYGKDVDEQTLAKIGHGKNGWLPTQRRNLEVFQKCAPELIELLKSVCEYTYQTGRIPQAIKGQIDSGQQYFEYILDNFRSPEGGAFSLDCNHQDFQGDPIGIVVPPLTINEKGRRGGVEEYIKETEALSQQGKLKGSLSVLQNTFVTELQFAEPQNGVLVVNGVKCVQPKESEKSGVSLYDAAHGERIEPGQPFTLTASKEVILCGGAYNTPQLLMLSGIGPEEHLQSKSIPVRLNAPGVGRNLQDRYEVAVVFEMQKGFELFKDCLFGKSDDPCLDLLNSDDPTQSPYSANSVAVALIERSPFAHFPADSAQKNPDLCLFAVPALFRGYYPGYSDSNFQNHQIPSSYRPTQPGNLYLCWLILKAHTKNENGRVLLKDKDPFSHPDIKFSYFDEGGTVTATKDLDAVVHAIGVVREIMKTEPFSRLEPKEVFESAEAQTPEQIREFVRNTAWGHHASCTCKIGTEDDPFAVLDGQFRVRGVENLRVVDASIFPEIPGIFIVLPIQMMAEKAAIDIFEKDRVAAEKTSDATEIESENVTTEEEISPKNPLRILQEAFARLWKMN